MYQNLVEITVVKTNLTVCLIAVILCKLYSKFLIAIYLKYNIVSCKGEKRTSNKWLLNKICKKKNSYSPKIKHKNN